MTDRDDAESRRQSAEDRLRAEMERDMANAVAYGKALDQLFSRLFNVAIPTSAITFPKSHK